MNMVKSMEKFFLQPDRDIHKLRDFGGILFILGITSLVASSTNGNYIAIGVMIIFGGFLYQIGEHKAKQPKGVS
jgi:hypothetical protein